MDLVANQATKRIVDEPMAGKRAFALEFAGDYEGLEMRIVVADNTHYRVVEAAFDQAGNLVRVHANRLSEYSGAEVYREFCALPNPRA